MYIGTAKRCAVLRSCTLPPKRQRPQHSSGFVLHREKRRWQAETRPYVCVGVVRRSNSECSRRKCARVSTGANGGPAHSLDACGLGDRRNGRHPHTDFLSLAMKCDEDGGCSTLLACALLCTLARAVTIPGKRGQLSSEF